MSDESDPGATSRRRFIGGAAAVATATLGGSVLTACGDRSPTATTTAPTAGQTTGGGGSTPTSGTALEKATLHGNEVIETPIGDITLVDNYFDDDASRRLFDEMDFQRNLEICMPYLGPVVGKYSDWTPLKDRGALFPEDLDKSDPWQFKNFRVV